MVSGSEADANMFLVPTLRNITDAELADIVAFMTALTGEYPVTERSNTGRCRRSSVGLARCQC